MAASLNNTPSKPTPERHSKPALARVGVWRKRLRTPGGEAVADDELINLVESHGGTSSAGWWSRVSAWSLGWVSARNQDGLLVGFVNVAWDGGAHGFLVDASDPRQATNTAGSVVSSCGRPPRTPKPPAASGFTSTLNRTLLGSNPEACGFQRPTPVSSICRQVELPDSSQATWPHARPAAPKGIGLRTNWIGQMAIR